MTTVLYATLVLLAIGGVPVLVRLAFGPTTHDRLVALDTLVIVVISGIAVHGALHHNGINLPLLVVVALVGFISTVSVVRLMPDENP